MTTRRATLVLGALEAFAPMSMDLYMPSLPHLADDLGTSVSLAQATMSACMLGMGVGQLLMGPASDRFGRRSPLLAGVALFTVLSFVCAFAPNIEVLLAARFLQGVAGSAGIVIGLAVARDLASGTELARLLSLLALVGALAPIIAPVVGGQLAGVMSWRGIFVVLTGVGVLLYGVTVFFLRETLPPAARHSDGVGSLFRGLGTILRDRLFATYVVVNACTGAAFFTYLAAISFVLEREFHLSPQQFSAVFAGNSVMAVVGAQVNRVALKRAGPARMYAVGAVLAAIAALAVLCVVGFGLGLAALLAALGGYMIATGINRPNGSTLALTDHGERAGTAAAVFGMSTMAVGPLIAPLVSLAGATGWSLGMTLTLASGIACALVLFVVIPTLQRRTTVVPGNTPHSLVE